MAFVYLSEEQIRLYNSSGTVYLNDYLDKAQVYNSTFSETRVVSCSNENYKLLPNTIVSGNIALGTTTTQRNGGIFATALSGSVGTASTSNTTNSIGDILNLVELRDATTHDPILDSGRVVYGLIQVSNTVIDGDSITGVGSENTQISFVVNDGTGTLTLVSLTSSVEFTLPLVYSSRNVPDLKRAGANIDKDVISVSIPTITNTYYTVTSQFAVNEIIDLTTGNGSGSGVSTKDGVTPLLPSTATLFKSNGNVVVLRNGLESIKGTGGDFEWVSSSSIRTNRKLKAGEILQIKAQSSY
jgi:hypothetical protein